MAIFNWIRGLLLLMVIIILCRTVFRMLGATEVALYLGYAALGVIVVGAVVTLIGLVVEGDKS